MLTLGLPEINETDTGVRLQAIFSINGIEKTLWYEVEKEYGDYLTLERSDGFVIGLLPLALKNGLNIKVNAPLSQKLYYNLNMHYLPLITGIFGVNQIKVHSDYLISKDINIGKAVGTGLSCGVDSFSTIYDHTQKDCIPEYKISHLTFFNVGSHGDHGGTSARELFKKRLELIVPCAEELQLDLVKVDSNISEVLHMGFPETHTLRSLSAVLVLQKLFRTYYYSSSAHLENFTLNKKYMGSYDLLNVNMLTNESLDIYSSSTNLTRVERTKLISNFQPAQKHLNVCVRGEINCGKCFKCMRTLLTLEIIGNIDDFSDLFDIKSYYEKRTDFISTVLLDYRRDIFLKEIFDEIRQTNYSIPLTSRLIAKYKGAKRHSRYILERTGVIGKAGV